MRQDGEAMQALQELFKSIKVDEAYANHRLKKLSFIYKIDAYFDVAITCFCLCQYEQSIRFMKEGMGSLSEEDLALFKQEDMYTDYIFFLGYVCAIAAKLDLTLEYYQECEERCASQYKQNQLIQKYVTRYMQMKDFLGRVYLQKGFYKQAFQQFQQSIALNTGRSENQVDAQSQAFKLANLSSVQLILGRIDEARQNIQKAITLFSSSNVEQNRVNLVICNCKLIEILLKRKQKKIYKNFKDIKLDAQEGAESDDRREARNIFKMTISQYNDLLNENCGQTLQLIFLRISALYYLEIEEMEDDALIQSDDVSRFELASSLLQTCYEIYMRNTNVPSAFQIVVKVAEIRYYLWDLEGAHDLMLKLVQEDKELFVNQVVYADCLFYLARTIYHLSYGRDGTDLLDLEGKLKAARDIYNNCLPDGNLKGNYCCLYIDVLIALKQDRVKLSSIQQLSNTVFQIITSYSNSKTDYYEFEYQYMNLIQLIVKLYRIPFYRNINFLNHSYGSSNTIQAFLDYLYDEQLAKEDLELIVEFLSKQTFSGKDGLLSVAVANKEISQFQHQ